MRARTSDLSIANADTVPVFSADERSRMIAEQAYYLAEARGFAAGHEIEDWLMAERAVDERLAGQIS